MTRTETQNQISDEIKHGASRAFSFMEDTEIKFIFLHFSEKIFQNKHY